MAKIVFIIRHSLFICNKYFMPTWKCKHLMLETRFYQKRRTRTLNLSLTHQRPTEVLCNNNTANYLVVGDPLSRLSNWIKTIQTRLPVKSWRNNTAVIRPEAETLWNNVWCRFAVRTHTHTKHFWRKGTLKIHADWLICRMKQSSSLVEGAKRLHFALAKDFPGLSVSSVFFSARHSVWRNRKSFF